MTAQTTQAPPATEAPAGKTARKKLPKVTKLFTNKGDLDKGQEDARTKGHTYDTRKFKVTNPGNGKTAFVLAYSPANACSVAGEAMGLQVEELDPTERQPFQLSVDKVKDRVKGMSEAEKAEILALLGAAPAPAKKEEHGKKK